MTQITVKQGAPTESGVQSFPFTQTFPENTMVRWDVEQGNAFVTTDTQAKKKWPDGSYDGFSDASTKSITVEASGEGQISVTINF